MGLEIFSLEGKTALVTGGSKGLGEAIARALASAGADIATCSRHLPELRQTADSIVKQTGRRVLPVECDVTRRDQVEAMVKRTLDEFGKIDILVNNAGYARKDPMLEADDEYWNYVMAVNVTAPMYFCRAVGRHMAQRRYGKIINMGSLYSLKGSDGKAAYATTKGAVLQLTRSLALEWAKYNITVNCICPGSMYTPMNAAALSKPEIVEMLAKKIPMGRSGQPEELAGAAIFLASDASRYVTGAILSVDGGWAAS
ncbi:SDR family NAD(P)-dependent oxidoreductase [Fontivita pretiosa]|uniref:SDR family NAD(P)-dependent oxidoreductase n=1 Tax=Fontivita pretiosa TaxID=2989684 RepID=UPI003D180B08